MGEQPTPAANAIELRIEEISQLFHTLDPFPFRERDLDADAEEFIVSWARELPSDQPLKIVVHVPESQASRPEARELNAAVTRYFAYRTQVISHELRELFRIGRRALAIGVTVLSLCVIADQAVTARLTSHPLGRFLDESLTLFGWVANWRPIEIFLYDWWPIVRRRNLYRRLSAAQVELKPYTHHTNQPAAPER
ncbi:MAG: hypothetical protein JWM63_5188 [Gammaproteobacteria bacterium]|jgi:hypothetical protein|nr:hypothetical protein [Gammaproteobacteria bacterium]